MTPETLDALKIGLNPASQLGLAVALFMMMTAIALSLRPDHFTFLRRDPVLYFGGLAAQLIALPAMTIALAMILNPPPSVALGMIVVASCPGGNVSNFMTWSARGDVAYSVSLTAGSSVVAALWTPLAILFWSSLYPPTADLLRNIEFDRVGFIAQTAFLLGAPLIIGMTTGLKAPQLAARLQKPLGAVGASILAVIIITGTIDFWPILIGAWRHFLAPVVIHNLAAFALGAAAGLLLARTKARRRTLAFEVGIQNTGLAIVLLLGQLEGLGGAAAVAASWGVWHFVSGGAMIGLYRRLDR